MEESFKLVDTKNSEHYNWGDNCDGWYFVKSDGLTVIKEMMPPMTKEKLHYHKKTQQFFFILSGTAEFEINGSNFTVEKGRGIHIKPNAEHRILNNGISDLEFIVVSEPESHGDRINVELR